MLHLVLLAGEVEFIEDGPNTTVLFRFEHQMPVLLVELKVCLAAAAAAADDDDDDF